MPPMTETRSLEGWEKFAYRRASRILTILQSMSELQARGSSKQKWKAQVSVIDGPKMRRLNFRYRGKNRVTDVLSFPSPEIFRDQGLLGDLVICLSVLKRQARELGHAPEIELDVLLTHGALHLLGFDHEKSARQAKIMHQWEIRALQALHPRKKAGPFGLIQRAHVSRTHS